jgi:hypothetical protein
LCGDEVEAPSEDERWGNILGKVLLEDHISSKLAFARDASFDDD